jgi:hypothetical protein
LPLAGGGGQIATSFRSAQISRSVFAGADVLAGDFSETSLAGTGFPFRG